MFADDAELLLPVLANTTYMIQGVIFFTTSATPDFKFQLTGPASPTDVTVRGSRYAVEGTSTNGTRGEFVDVALSVPRAVVGTNSGSDGYVDFRMRLENGANAGTVVLQWAQNTSDAADTTVLAGSHLNYIRVP